jgi:hypothetical protein
LPSGPRLAQYFALTCWVADRLHLMKDSFF